MSSVEQIKEGNRVLAIIVPADFAPTNSKFVTPGTYEQQVGFIVYGAGETIVPHMHRDIERNLQGTKEVILVRDGHCWVDFYLEDKSLKCSRELKPGDIVVLVSGGHGFRMIENTVLLEIKQGPYMGDSEKERFSPLRDA